MKEFDKYDDRLASLYNEMKESHIYKSSESGLLGGINTDYGLIEIFNPWIKTLLFWKVFDGPTKKININSLHYRDCYINGYVRGQFYFNDRFRNDPLETKDTISINILEAEKLVKTYFEKIPLILNDKVFDDQGYNAGIYADVILFKREKPAFFTEVHQAGSSQQNKPKVKDELGASKSISEPMMFKDLFYSTEKYNKAINILVKNNYIEKNKNGLRWTFTRTKEFTINQTIIALCVVLEKNGYFKDNVRAVYRNIENEFNIPIDKSNYSRSSNGFKNDYEKTYSKNYSYISLFKDIL